MELHLCLKIIVHFALHVLKILVLIITEKNMVVAVVVTDYFFRMHLYLVLFEVSNFYLFSILNSKFDSNT